FELRALVVGDAARDLRELRRADLLCPRAQRRDRRNDLERGPPRTEALHLVGRELLRALRFGASALQRLRDDRLEIVGVVEKAAVETRELRVQVPRQGRVDEEERMPAPRR